MPTCEVLNSGSISRANKKTNTFQNAGNLPNKKKSTSLTGDTPKDQVAMKELWPVRAEKVFQMDALIDNSHTPVRHENNTWPEQAK